jgi:hypothetical protein
MTESVGPEEMEGPADSGADSEGVPNQRDGGADGGARGRLGSNAGADREDAETDRGAED